ncbi:hypothetical protein Sjap_017144 [Stephania japonica]|uniref:Uncharacterized protein n=1 Tax=Stephania japonica TaxID=461633 RepID=A0AAP0I5M2_9MAGN
MHSSDRQSSSLYSSFLSGISFCFIKNSRFSSTVSGRVVSNPNRQQHSHNSHISRQFIQLRLQLFQRRKKIERSVARSELDCVDDKYFRLVIGSVLRCHYFLQITVYEGFDTN